MTLQELCLKYDLSESTVKDHFKNVQKTLLKKYNINIIKIGRGASASYEIEEQEQNDRRALTLYDEMRENIQIEGQVFSTFASWDFLVFLAIVITPMHVFRGTIEDFLDYVQVKKTPANIEATKEALENLVEKDYIKIVYDKTKFTAILYEKVEESMNIQLNMIKKCKILADSHKKRSWVPLLKTWVGMEIVSNNQPFTIQDLCVLTGLSRYQISESVKVLKADNVIRTSRAYINYATCIGQNVDINALSYQSTHEIK